MTSACVLEATVNVFARQSGMFSQQIFDGVTICDDATNLIYLDSCALNQKAPSSGSPTNWTESESTSSATSAFYGNLRRTDFKVSCRLPVPKSQPCTSGRRYARSRERLSSMNSGAKWARSLVCCEATLEVPNRTVCKSRADGLGSRSA